MKKTNTSIDVLKLQGAQRMTSKSGRDIIVIDIAESRLKPHQNGSVYLALDVVENKDGENQYGNTHFIVEPTTKDERESGVKLPILGNGKEWGGKPAAQPQRQQAPQRRGNFPAAKPSESYSKAQGDEEDSIPF